MSTSASKALFNLEHLAKARAWNYEKPTLVRKARFTNRISANSESFTHMFYGKYPTLKDLSFENLLIKGGCVADILLDSSSSDIDIYIVGIKSDDAALKRAETLLKDLVALEKGYVASRNQAEIEIAKKKNYERPRSDYKPEIKAVRHGHVVTVTLSAVRDPIQIILLRFDSIEACLNDCDLGASAVGFDGKQVWFTERGKFAWENYAIKLEPTMFSVISFKRIEKYFNKGFDIILPSLDMGKVPNYYRQKLKGMTDAVILNGMAVSFEEVSGNKIYVHRFFEVPLSAAAAMASDKKTPDIEGCEGLTAEEDDDGRVSDISNGRSQSEKTGITIAAENLFKLVHGETKQFNILAGGDNILDVLNVRPPGLSIRQVNNMYYALKRKLLPEDATTLDYGVARKFYVKYPLVEVVKMLFVKPDKTGIAEAAEKLTKDHIAMAEAKLAEVFPPNKDPNDKVVVRKKEFNDPEIFVRCFKDEATFYGEFYKAG